MAKMREEHAAKHEGSLAAIIQEWAQKHIEEMSK